MLRREERGATLVEFALVLPIFLMLVVGMVSAGIAYNHKLSLTHAAREAGRYGATLPVTSFASLNLWLDDLATRVADNATGSLEATAPNRYICVAYVFPNGPISSVLDHTRRREESPSGLVTYADGACPGVTDTRPGGERRVQVQVRRDTDIEALFFSTTVTLNSQALSRYEVFVGS
jgi:hypothetical protein